MINLEGLSKGEVPPRFKFASGHKSGSGGRIGLVFAFITETLHNLSGCFLSREGLSRRIAGRPELRCIERSVKGSMHISCWYPA